MRVRVIANPASGTNREAVAQIEAALAAHSHLESEMCLTEQAGDAERFAASAQADGIDRVLSWGGDGTVMEVLTGLQNSPVPLGILPGGTANVMSVELGIPTTLDGALALALADDITTRTIDLGAVDNRSFMLRVGFGYEAEFSAGTSREDKKKWGRFAYLRTAITKLRGLQPTRYLITLDDGQVVVSYGVTCMICNSSSMGFGALRFVPDGSVSDGLLDVVVVHRVFEPGSFLRALTSMVHSIFPRLFPTLPRFETWRTSRVVVEVKKPQMIALDGEPMKRGKRVTAWAIPGVVNVIVPLAALPAAAPPAETSAMATASPAAGTA